MQKISLIFLFVFFMIAVRAGEAAPAKMTLVFRHGSDWCQSGETILNGAWSALKKDPTIASNWHFLTHDTPENPTDATKAKNAPVDKFGKVAVGAFPALSLHNSKGQCFALFTGLANKITVAELADKISAAQKNYQQFEQEYQKAKSLTGDEKTKQLFKCTERLTKYIDVGVLKSVADPKKHDSGNFGWLFAELYASDPDDKLGYKWRYGFGADAYTYRIQGMAKAKTFAEAEKYLEGELSKSGYQNLTIEQQQVLHSLKFVLYKNEKNKEAENIAVLKKVYQMKPGSHWGEGAAGYLRIFGQVMEIGIPHGWNKSFCKVGDNVWQVRMGVRRNFPVPLYDYRVVFSYQGGDNALTIKKIELREGENILVAAEKPQTINAQNSDASFLLKWRHGKAVTNPEDLRLFVYYTTDGENSNGTIKVTPEL